MFDVATSHGLGHGKQDVNGAFLEQDRTRHQVIRQTGKIPARYSTNCARGGESGGAVYMVAGRGESW